MKDHSGQIEPSIGVRVFCRSRLAEKLPRQLILPRSQQRFPALAERSPRES